MDYDPTLQAQAKREHWEEAAQTAAGREDMKKNVRLEGQRGGRKPLVQSEPLLALAVEDCVLF